jgi:hypothetical protein
MTSSLVVEIGNYPVRFSTDDPALLGCLRTRFGDFVTEAPSSAPVDFSVRLLTPGLLPGGRDIQVTHVNGCWRFARDLFHSEWFPKHGRGSVRTSPLNFSRDAALAVPGPMAASVDSTLRVLHTLLLAPGGGFLLHAASAVRNGKAFVFSGVSGAGKSTISRLAPPDVTLLTDEISYICPQGETYRAFGTPFVGDLSRNGANISAPLKEINLLAQGSSNKRELLPPPKAAAGLLRNVLFFAVDPEYVPLVFETACRVASTVPIYRLTFVPTEEVWEMIS